MKERLLRFACCCTAFGVSFWYASGCVMQFFFQCLIFELCSSHSRCGPIRCRKLWTQRRKATLLFVTMISEGQLSTILRSVSISSLSQISFKSSHKSSFFMFRKCLLCPFQCNVKFLSMIPEWWKDLLIMKTYQLTKLFSDYVHWLTILFAKFTVHQSRDNGFPDGLCA